LGPSDNVSNFVHDFLLSFFQSDLSVDLPLLALGVFVERLFSIKSFHHWVDVLLSFSDLFFPDIIMYFLVKFFDTLQVILFQALAPFGELSSVLLLSVLLEVVHVGLDV
jgi:hypothetical protein